VLAAVIVTRRLGAVVVEKIWCGRQIRAARDRILSEAYMPADAAVSNQLMPELRRTKWIIAASKNRKTP
jgi:hypothetical protein